MHLLLYIKNLDISFGRAAEILGVHKTDLITYYNRKGIPYLDQTEEEIENDIACWKEVRKKRN